MGTSPLFSSICKLHCFVKCITSCNLESQMFTLRLDLPLFLLLVMLCLLYPFFIFQAHNSNSSPQMLQVGFLPIMHFNISYLYYYHIVKCYTNYRNGHFVNFSILTLHYLLAYFCHGDVGSIFSIL